MKYLFAFLLSGFLFTGNTSFAQAGNIKNEIRIERYKAITLRDGVKLFADVYLPAAPGKYPTIVILLVTGAT